MKTMKKGRLFFLLSLPLFLGSCGPSQSVVSSSFDSGPAASSVDSSIPLPPSISESDPIIEESSEEPLFDSSEEDPVTSEQAIKTSESSLEISSSKAEPTTSEPTPATSEPIPESSEPAPATSEPMPASSEPIPETSEPLPETSEPTPATSEPTLESSEPLSSEVTSVEPSSEFISSEEISSEELSSEEPVSSSDEGPTDGTYHFYCVNDFHGAVLEQNNGSYYENGIVKCFSRLKSLKKADPDHTFILSAGDMFQGSFESNFNYGHLVIDEMNETGFDAMAIGNHEFDYGPQYVTSFTEWASFPILGGNIMAWDHGVTDDPWQDGLLPSSTVIARGGNKIGIVGMIGEGQTTSITSRYVSDAAFVDPSELAKAEAKRLREEENCSIVVYLIHDEAEACRDYACDKTYFDGVFTAHTHRKENEYNNGVPVVQSYCNGEYISHFAVTIANGIATSGKGENIRCSSYWSKDSKIDAICGEYLTKSEYSSKATAFAGTVEGTLTAKEGVPNLTCKAMYEKYKELYPQLDCAMENGQRANLSGTVSYRDVFKASPFENHIVIARVKGSDILREAAYNSVYSPNISTYQKNSYYTIAVINYLIYHQNTSKTYDYFTSLNNAGIDAILGEYSDPPYDIAFNYMKSLGTIKASDYSSGASGFHIG